MSLIECTGSKSHRRHRQPEIIKSKGPFPAEADLYSKFGLAFIEPDLREGYDEVERAAEGTLPVLVPVKDVRGERHAYSTSSDGSHSIEKWLPLPKTKATSISVSPIILRA